MSRVLLHFTVLIGTLVVFSIAWASTSSSEFSQFRTVFKFITIGCNVHSIFNNVRLMFVWSLLFHFSVNLQWFYKVKFTLACLLMCSFAIIVTSHNLICLSMLTPVQSLDTSISFFKLLNIVRTIFAKWIIASFLFNYRLQTATCLVDDYFMCCVTDSLS